MATSAPVDLLISPPQIPDQIICDPLPNDKTLLAFWSSWNGQSLPDRQAGLIRRDLRHLRKLDAVRWAPVLRQAYGLLPQIDANFGQDAAAMAEVELLLALGQHTALKQSGLVHKLLRGASKKSPRTQKNLAQYLRLGLGVEVNAKAADRLLVKAAYGGNADALLSLAQRSLDGEKIIGWTVAPSLAVSMGFTALIGKIDAFICNRVSRIAREYRAGTIVAKNDALADQWYQFAARLGDPTAAWKVAQAHLRSEDLVKDNAVLLHHLKQAADGGIGQAQLALAQIYRQGALVAEDQQIAAQLYSTAAETLGRIGLMRQAVFLGDALKSTPDRNAPQYGTIQSQFNTMLGQLNALPDGPGWALRRAAKDMLTVKGRWAGAAAALLLLDQAAEAGDGEALQKATELRLATAHNSQQFQILVDSLSSNVVQYGRIEAMKSLQKAFTCKAPDAPRRSQALYWQRAVLATGVDGANARPVLAVERQAVAQTQALYGRPTALASFLAQLRAKNAPAAMQTLWQRRAAGVDALALAQGKLRLKTLGEHGDDGALKFILSQAIAQEKHQASTLLATVLLTGPQHTKGNMSDITQLLNAAAQKGNGQAMALLRQTPDYANHHAVFLTYADVIETRGDFEALLLALPYVHASRRTTYIRRAIATAPCDFSSSVQFASVLSHIGQIELARQWLAIASFIATDHSQRQINLGDAYIRVLGHGGLEPGLAAYERAYRAGKSAAADRLLKHYNDENSPVFDPLRAQEITLSRAKVKTRIATIRPGPK